MIQEPSHWMSLVTDVAGFWELDRLSCCKGMQGIGCSSWAVAGVALVLVLLSWSCAAFRGSNAQSFKERRSCWATQTQRQICAGWCEGVVELWSIRCFSWLSGVMWWDRRKMRLVLHVPPGLLYPFVQLSLSLHVTHSAARAHWFRYASSDLVISTMKKTEELEVDEAFQHP